MPASNDPSINVEGLGNLIRSLKALNPELVKELREFNKALATELVGPAKSKAPVRSGRLAGSIRAGATQRSGVVRAGTKSVPYVKPIHFGWPTRPNPQRGWRGGRIRPNPFLYEALDHRREQLITKYIDKVQQIIDGNIHGS